MRAPLNTNQGNKRTAVVVNDQQTGVCGCVGGISGEPVISLLRSNINLQALQLDLYCMSLLSSVFTAYNFNHHILYY